MIYSWNTLKNITWKSLTRFIWGNAKRLTSMNTVWNGLTFWTIRRLTPLLFWPIVTVILNQCIIFGATNVKRVSKKTELKTIGDKKFTISGNFELTDFRLNVNFDAKLGFPKYRWHPQLKTCCVSIRNCVFYVEYEFNLKDKTICVKEVNLVSRDRIRCISTGFLWPFSRTVETLIRKNVEQFIDDNQTTLENMAKKAVNESFAPTFEELFDETSLVSKKEFKTIINGLKEMWNTIIWRLPVLSQLPFLVVISSEELCHKFFFLSDLKKR